MKNTIVLSLLFVLSSSLFAAAPAPQIKQIPVNLMQTLYAVKPELINTRDKNGDTWLTNAIKTNNVQALMWLFRQNFNPDIADKDGYTPLMLFTNDEAIPLVTVILDKNADPDLQDPEGNTALMYAIRNNNEDLTRLLLNGTPTRRRRTNSNLRNTKGQSPLAIAIDQKNKNIVQLLLEAGADSNIQDNFNNTPLMYAALNGHVGITKLLLNAEANPNLQDNNGNTALMHAAHKGLKNIAKLLLKAGADADLQTTNGNAALILAAEHNKPEMAQLLLEAGANINIKDGNQSTPLMYAAHKGHKDIVKILVDKGADLSLQNKNGATALMVALLDNNFDIALDLAKALPEALSQSNTQKITPFDVIKKNKTTIGKTSFTKFKKLVGLYTTQLSPEEIDQAIKELKAAHNNFDTRTKAIVKKSKGPKFTPAQPEAAAGPAREPIGPQHALTPAEAIAKGFVLGRKSPQNSTQISLSQTLQDWNSDGQQTLEHYGYLNPNSETPDQRMRRRIFEQTEEHLRATQQNPMLAIIMAHTVVPTSVMRYLIANTPSTSLDNNDHKIVIPNMTITLPGVPPLEGTYELLYEKQNDTRSHVFHSLFKDNALQNITTETPGTVHISELTRDAASAPDDTWQTVVADSGITIDDTHSAETVLTDNASGNTYSIPKL
ncbi:MAG: ankyrin repeat protein [Alteromonas naphthalenivorans]|jgi:ankyrin repeat protein